MQILKKKGIVILAIVILSVLMFPYLKSEYLTKKYGYEFYGLEKLTSMLDESDYYKVIDYSSETAVVLYVSEYSKDEITFAKDESGFWTIQEWKTIWSKYGSADEFYWPYYN